MPELPKEIEPIKPVRPVATKLIGKCPDCATPMRRYCTIGAKMAITEQAVYCLRCKGWMKRSITYGKETFAVCLDPRRDKAQPLPTLAREVEP